MEGLFSIIPVSALLAVTFLVLAAADKLEKGILRTFGLLIAVLLIIGTTLVAVATVDMAAKGTCISRKKMGKMCPIMKHQRYKK